MAYLSGRERRKLDAQVKTIKLWRWRVDIRRGGQQTPWPWTEATLCRREPRPLRRSNQRP